MGLEYSRYDKSRFRQISFSALGHIHGHDAGPVKDDAAAAGDDALDGFAGLGMFFERVVVHGLNDFEALVLLSFFLGKSFVKISWHGQSVFGRGSLQMQSGRRKLGKDLR